MQGGQPASTAMLQGTQLYLSLIYEVKYVYVCMYGHHTYSRVLINRVRLPILLVVS